MIINSERPYFSGVRKKEPLTRQKKGNSTPILLSSFNYRKKILILLRIRLRRVHPFLRETKGKLAKLDKIGISFSYIYIEKSESHSAKPHILFLLSCLRPGKISFWWKRKWSSWDRMLILASLNRFFSLVWEKSLPSGPFRHSFPKVKKKEPCEGGQWALLYKWGQISLSY